MVPRSRLWPLCRWPPGRRRLKPQPLPCRPCSGSRGWRRVWHPRRTAALLATRSSVPFLRGDRSRTARSILRSDPTLPTVELLSLQTLAHHLPTQCKLLGNIPPQFPPRESQSAKSSELRFRALLTEDGAER